MSACTIAYEYRECDRALGTKSLVSKAAASKIWRTIIWTSPDARLPLAELHLIVCNYSFARYFTSPGQIVLDVGANVGEFAVAAWSITRSVNWHAFRLKAGLRLRWRALQNQMFSPEDWARVRLPEQLLFLCLPLRRLSWVTRHLSR
jgi:hypothetical protein